MLLHHTYTSLISCTESAQMISWMLIICNTTKKQNNSIEKIGTKHISSIHLFYINGYNLQNDVYFCI